MIHRACSRHCRLRADELNEAALNCMSGLLFRRVAPYDSIMFPLFGTRNPDRVPEAVAFELLETVLSYLAAKPFSWLDRIYFLAYTDSDLRLITGAIKKAKLKLLSV